MGIEIIIATLKEEPGGLIAYIRKNRQVERFLPGGIYYSIALNTQLLIEAVLYTYPGALFVDSTTFEHWDDEKEGDE